jgi:ribosomal protein L17
MEDISDNFHYSEYIQFFFNKINKFKSSKNISLLINCLESLIETSKEETTKERAKDFAEEILKSYQHLL